MKDKEPALVRLGENIRLIRKEKGISQEELAHQACLDRTYVSGVERGDRNPTVLSSLKIAKALDVDLAELVKEVTSA
ncbi:helix-turn-helix domain-containing protein [Rubritalea marina]|uniref:helix-turn-helix domain-containing protein n=1 Tax=Rubritalea marina TaxID=361055 RepID=UPI0004774842